MSAPADVIVLRELITKLRGWQVPCAMADAWLAALADSAPVYCGDGDIPIFRTVDTPVGFGATDYEFFEKPQIITVKPNQLQEEIERSNYLGEDLFQAKQLLREVRWEDGHPEQFFRLREKIDLFLYRNPIFEVKKDAPCKDRPVPEVTSIFEHQPDADFKNYKGPRLAEEMVESDGTCGEDVQEIRRQVLRQLRNPASGPAAGRYQTFRSEYIRGYLFGEKPSKDREEWRRECALYRMTMDVARAIVYGRHSDIDNGAERRLQTLERLPLDAGPTGYRIPTGKEVLIQAQLDADNRGILVDYDTQPTGYGCGDVTGWTSSIVANVRWELIDA